jgi:hypothetical protein
METLDPEELGRRPTEPSFRAAMTYVQQSGAAELGHDLREDRSTR